MPSAPLLVAGIDETRGSSLPVSSKSFRLLIRFVCEHIFDNSARESTTSTMKKGGSGTNESDLNKDNTINPTLDHLTEKDHKTLEAYHKKVDDLFSRHKGRICICACAIGFRNSAWFCKFSMSAQKNVKWL
jgi:hypothetical protein